MAPTAYSGALPPKKKSELQEIANALRISDQGTKDELQARIKKHLDANQDALEDDPIFSGLFGRRKRSVQPQPIASSGRFAPSSSDTIEKPRSSTGRRITALDPIREGTPVKDLRDVSTFLKHPFSPAETTPVKSPRAVDIATPSSLPPLPPSLPPSPAKSIIERLPKASEVKAAVENKQEEVLQNGYKLLSDIRIFLSNSRNIWSLTSVFELLYIIKVVVPWKHFEVPIPSKGSSGFSIAYPPLSVFQTNAFCGVLLHWAIPTLIIPTLVGYMISFNPANLPAKSDAKPSSPPVIPLDPLTSAIIRLAAQFIYPFKVIEAHAGVVGLDVLGSDWRVLSASVGLAFAFSEAISGAPQTFAKSFAQEQQQRYKAIQSAGYDEHQPTPGRRALMAEEEVDDAEVD